jgi:pimeloyl-ACP methyl ester carboxylesterase
LNHLSIKKYQLDSQGQRTGPSVHLDLKNIKKMYERSKATPENGFEAPYNFSTEPIIPSVGYQIHTADGHSYQEPSDEEKKALVFVHGWNMTFEEYHNFSETMFKRLWHKHYKGRFCSFRWPTLTDADSYNTSEYRAWKYGAALKAYVSSLPNDYTKNIAAHSMGNIVAGSALKQGMTITNYALMQAAVPAGCYNTNVNINNYDRFIRAEVNDPTPDYASLEKGYRGYLTGVSGNLVNFYNAVDFALVAGSYFGIEVSWEKNQISYKPDDPLGSGYYNYNLFEPFGSRTYITFAFSPRRFVTDPHEVMSFVARPRSQAVGAGNYIGTPIDVGEGSTSAFSRERSDHSGQFNRNIQNLNPFYQQFVEQLRLTPNQ